MTDTSNPRLERVQAALDDLKAKHVKCIKVTDLTDVADYMVVASGTSGRHLRALANEVIEQSKHAGDQPLGVEGLNSGEWALVDLGDILVHIMLPAVREHYDLESLWTVRPQPQDGH